ncbi:MAG: glycosyltransferase [Thermoprotei archaeon]
MTTKTVFAKLANALTQFAKHLSGVVGVLEKTRNTPSHRRAPDELGREKILHSNNALQDKKSVLVGIPVYNDEKTITCCLENVLNQTQRACHIQNVLIVASGCTDRTTELVKIKRNLDGRILLFEEGERYGKASALNRIFEFFRAHNYDYLIVTNGDAVLRGDAVDRLVEHAERTQSKLVCGKPEPITDPHTPLDAVYEFIWGLHNEFLRLGYGFKKPHCTDELMCFSHNVYWSIPVDTINDGAYFSILLAGRGEKSEHCAKAIVGVSVPLSILGLIKQRSRIILGHILLKKKLHTTSDTFESVMFRKPQIAVGILVHQLLKHGITCFIKAGAIECISLGVALLRSTSNNRAWVWERVEHAGASV